MLILLNILKVHFQHSKIVHLPFNMNSIVGPVFFLLIFFVDFIVRAQPVGENKNQDVANGKS